LVRGAFHGSPSSAWLAALIPYLTAKNVFSWLTAGWMEIVPLPPSASGIGMTMFPVVEAPE